MDRPDPLPSFHRLQRSTEAPLPPLPAPSQAACYKLLMMPSWALDPRALSALSALSRERDRERERIFWHGATEANPIFTSGYKSSGRKSPTEYRGAN